MLIVTEPVSGCAATRSARPSSRRSNDTPPRRGSGETFISGVCAAAIWLSRACCPSNHAVGAHPPCVRDQLFEALHIHRVEAHHDQRPAVVPASREELVRFTPHQGLLLRLVAHEEHRDVGADEAGLTRLALRIGPDESLATGAEVESVALDL